MEIPILTALETANPRMLKRTVLQADVTLAVDSFSMTTFDRALVVLEQKGQIRLYPGEDVQRVKITDDGLDRLAATR